MADAKYHLDDIPDGFQIFEERLEIAGVSYHRDEAAKFIRGNDLWLEFERDAANPHDKNAIKITGCSKGLFGINRYFLGYVPADVARAVVEGDYFEKVRPRLLKTYLGATGYAEILFQILGPKGERFIYERADPESLPQSQLARDAHFTDFVSQVKYLKQQKRHQEAIDLLLRLVAATEGEAERDKTGVAPWYYEQLAMLYRKDKKHDEEIEILERFERQPKSPGVGPEKLAQRLQQARALRDKNRA